MVGDHIGSPGVAFAHLMCIILRPFTQRMPIYWYNAKSQNLQVDAWIMRKELCDIAHSAVWCSCRNNAALTATSVHITVRAPDPVRSQKLSTVEPG
jgi:hypothetical protein